MSMVAVGIGGGVAALAGGIGGAMISSSAAQNAANTQAGAANNASELQYQEFQQQQANQQPWINAGTEALGQEQTMSANAPSFTAQDFANNEDPAYAFDLQQGQQAIQRSAAAGGGLQSGGTLKSLSDYSQGQASNEYQNAYSRYMNNQNTQFNRLASIAGTGQTANTNLNAAGMNTTNAVSANTIGAGNAQAAASIAGGQQWGNTMSSLGTGLSSTGMQVGMMNKLFPTPTTPNNNLTDSDYDNLAQGMTAYTG
jgi:hypothetical protein